MERWRHQVGWIGSVRAISLGHPHSRAICSSEWAIVHYTSDNDGVAGRHCGQRFREAAADEAQTGVTSRSVQPIGAAGLVTFSSFTYLMFLCHSWMPIFFDVGVTAFIPNKCYIVELKIAAALSYCESTEVNKTQRTVKCRLILLQFVHPQIDRRQTVYRRVKKNETNLNW